ncbi:hypothetical protein D3C71_1881500 [compost metagenome]
MPRPPPVTIATFLCPSDTGILLHETGDIRMSGEPDILMTLDMPDQFFENEDA